MDGSRARRRSPPAAAVGAGTRGLRWSGWIGYGYGTTTYESALDPEFPGAFDQRHLVTVSTTAQLGERWDAAATVRLATNWPYEGWFEDRGEGRICPLVRAQRPAPARLRATRSPRALPRAAAARPAALFAEALNATDRANYRQVSATINLRTFAIGRLSEKQLPIIPAVGFAYEF